MGLGSSHEDSRKIQRRRMNRKCRWSYSGSGGGGGRKREKKRGVMEVTPRLIHTQRRNSLKRHRNAKRLAQLTASHILLATPPFLCLLTDQTTPHPLLSSTVSPVAMSTTPPPPAPRLACIHFDFLPVLISS